jgi:hypothetical protein
MAAQRRQFFLSCVEVIAVWSFADSFFYPNLSVPGSDDSFLIIFFLNIDQRRNHPPPLTLVSSGQ